MTSLTAAPVAEVLDRLFADAARNHAEFRGRGRPPGDRSRHSEDDPRAFFARAKHRYMAVSRQTGSLLYLLARTTEHARSPSSGRRSGSP